MSEPMVKVINLVPLIRRSQIVSCVNPYLSMTGQCVLSSLNVVFMCYFLL